MPTESFLGETVVDSRDWSWHLQVSSLNAFELDRDNSPNALLVDLWPLMAEGLEFYALKAVTASTALQNPWSYLFNYA
jgi:hypothetical protein